MDSNEANSDINSNSVSSFAITDPNTDYYDKNHNGPFVCIVQYADKSLNINNLHLLQFSKLIHKHVEGVVSIQSAGASRVKIAFSSSAMANKFLNSPILTEFNWSASIPSSSIYSFGVIRIKQSFTEQDFWDGMDSGESYRLQNNFHG